VLYTGARSAAKLHMDKKDKLMLKNLLRLLDRLVAKTEYGQDLAEYSVFIGLIALVVVISITLIGTEISEIFIAIATAITNGI